MPLRFFSPHVSIHILGRKTLELSTAWCGQAPDSRSLVLVFSSNMWTCSTAGMSSIIRWRVYVCFLLLYPCFLLIITLRLSNSFCYQLILLHSSLVECRYFCKEKGKASAGALFCLARIDTRTEAYTHTHKHSTHTHTQMYRSTHSFPLFLLALFFSFSICAQRPLANILILPLTFNTVIFNYLHNFTCIFIRERCCLIYFDRS